LTGAARSEGPTIRSTWAMGGDGIEPPTSWV
jgi:hypothetical protein